MSKENIRVVQIDTNPATKSLKDLRNELKGYKDQMANLEEGSDAFLHVANKAGELKHQIDEISQSIRGASADFGDMVGNVTNLTAGIIGAFEAVAGGLQAMGIESEAIDETIKRMQGLMAVVQGLSAIDDGIKAMDKLAASITSTSKAARLLKTVLQPKIFLAIAAAITAITLAWNKWGDKIKEAVPFIGKISDFFSGIKDNITGAREEQEKLNEELTKSLALKIDESITPEEKFKVYVDEIRRIREEIRKLNEDGISKEVKDLYNKYLNMVMEIEKLGIAYNEMHKANFERLEQVKKELDEIAKKGAFQSPRDLERAKELHEEFVSIIKQLGEYALYLDSAGYIVVKNKPKPKTTPTESAPKELERNPDVGIDLMGSVSLLDVEPLTKAAEEIGLDIGKVMADAEIKARNARWKAEVEAIENSGNQIFEGLKETMSAFSDSSLGLTRGWIASLDQFQLAFQQTMAIVKDEGTVSWESYGAVAATALGGIGTMLNALSQEQDASNVEGFEQMKKLQIAATTMNMLSGVMAAWTSSMALPAPASFIAASIQTAATVALGAAQIAKIKSQTMESANPNTNINAKSVGSMIIPPVQYSSAVQGASTESSIQNTKVYVTESDIEKTIQKVHVQESENTY